MKKRIFRVLAAAMIISLLAVQGVYAAAGDLTVESIFPETNDTGLQIANQMARIVFNGEMDVNTNKNYFKIVDSKGEAQKIMVLEQADNPKRINLVLADDLKENEEYTIIIDAAAVDKNGNTLGKEFRSKFKTKSQKRESLVTTIMMVVMFGAIIIFTVRDQAKKTREAQEEQNRQGKKKPEKVNPYKNAKKEAERIYAKKQNDKKRKVREEMMKREENKKRKK